MRFIFLRTLLILFLLLALACASSLTLAQQSYDVGDWTSYKDFRYARALDIGNFELFVATSGGILEYHLLRQQWLDPWVVGYGLSEPVTLDDPILIFYDTQTNYLWVATRTQLLQYDTSTERWRIIAQHLWGPGNRVVNMGAGGNAMYVETIPDDVFANIFPFGTPLPDPIWHNYATRYKGSRTFGGFMLDTDVTDPPDTRWRGLRTKLPLSDNELFGALGFPPLNFPGLIFPPGYVMHTDGNILDPALRGAPITDWIVDQYGYLHTTHWGTGIVRADLRTSRTELHMLGPAGNDIHTLFVGADAIWMGGFSAGDRKGFSRASRDLHSWQSFETRDNAKIRSTIVYDFTDWNNGTWIATDDGLISFNAKKGEWTRYGAGQNLHADQVRALAATDSELWIGTARGLAVMTRPGMEIWRMSEPGIELNGVTKLAISGDTLYVATPSGLFKGHVRDRKFSYVDLDPKLLNAPVLDVSIIDSEIWLATAEGVMRYDEVQGESKSWYALDWLAGAEPACLHAMRDFVWVGTHENGFFRYRKETGEWIQYSEKDGLVDDRVQVIRSDGDDLLIGTANGLTRFFWNRPGRTR